MNLYRLKRRKIFKNQLSNDDQLGLVRVIRYWISLVRGPKIWIINSNIDVEKFHVFYFLFCLELNLFFKNKFVNSQFEHNLKTRIKYELIKIKKIIFVILFLFRILIGGLGV